MLSGLGDMLQTVETRLRSLSVAYRCSNTGNVWRLPQAVPLYNEMKSAGYHVLCAMVQNAEAEREYKFSMYHLERASYDSLELTLDGLLIQFRALMNEKHGVSHIVASKLGRENYNRLRLKNIAALRYIFEIDSIRNANGTSRREYFKKLPEHMKALEQYISAVRGALPRREIP